MSIWSRIVAAISALAAGEGLSAAFERLRTPPERSVAFTIAIIALGAKMAKADGRVTRDEVAAFRRIFTIPRGEEANAARVFDLARQDVAGFDAWARRIARMFRRQPAALEDILDGLFRVAVVDGDYHPAEDAFLAEVARIFALPEATFRRLRARHVPGSRPDPYEVLGIAPDAPLEALRAAWRAAVRSAHPDRAMARGLPPEAVRLAEDRLVQINEAWDQIRALRAGRASG